MITVCNRPALHRRSQVAFTRMPLPVSSIPGSLPAAITGYSSGHCFWLFCIVLHAIITRWPSQYRNAN